MQVERIPGRWCLQRPFAGFSGNTVPLQSLLCEPVCSSWEWRCEQGKPIQGSCTHRAQLCTVTHLATAGSST